MEMLIEHADLLHSQHSKSKVPSLLPQGPSVWVRELGRGCLVWNGLWNTIWWCSRDISHNKLREDNAVAL